MAARVGRLYVAAAFMAARERGAGVSRMPPKRLETPSCCFGGNPAATKVWGDGTQAKACGYKGSGDEDAG